jgi:hypothetical protein
MGVIVGVAKNEKLQKPKHIFQALGLLSSLIRLGLLILNTDSNI